MVLARARRTAALTAALTATLLAGPVTAASAAPSPQEPGKAKFTANLIAQHSNKCLDVFGGGTQDGASVIQWTCTNSANQQWKLVQQDNGYFTVVARHSGKCLDVFAGGTQDGAHVIQWTCHNGANQRWRLG